MYSEKQKMYREIHKYEISNYQKAYQRAYYLDLKSRIMSHYSPTSSCQYCGTSDIRVLSIDHIAGNGAEYRRQLRVAGKSFYQWLERNNYPEGYQVLCMNCQFIKRHEEWEVKREGD